jgi:hypothetical protein
MTGCSSPAHEPRAFVLQLGRKIPGGRKSLIDQFCHAESIAFSARR